MTFNQTNMNIGDVNNRCDAMALMLPAHKGSLCLEHNPGRDVYQTVAQYLACREDVSPGITTFRSDADRQRCIDTDSIWVLRWYPLTPISFYEVAAPTLEDVLLLANQMEK